MTKTEQIPVREEMILKEPDAFAQAATASNAPIAPPQLVHHAPLSRNWFSGGTADSGAYEATIRKDGATFYVRLLSGATWNALLDAERQMLIDVQSVAADRDAAAQVLGDYQAFQVNVLADHLVNWTLPVALCRDAIEKLNRAAIEELCAELQLKSSLGKETSAFLGGR